MDAKVPGLLNRAQELHATNAVRQMVQQELDYSVLGRALLREIQPRGA
jgi:hypothetical protein